MPDLQQASQGLFHQQRSAVGSLLFTPLGILWKSTEFADIFNIYCIGLHGFGELSRDQSWVEIPFSPKNSELLGGAGEGILKTWKYHMRTLQWWTVSLILDPPCFRWCTTSPPGVRQRDHPGKFLRCPQQYKWALNPPTTCYPFGLAVWSMLSLAVWSMLSNSSSTTY